MPGFGGRDSAEERFAKLKEAIGQAARDCDFGRVERLRRIQEDLTMLVKNHPQTTERIMGHVVEQRPAPPIQVASVSTYKPEYVDGWPEENIASKQRELILRAERRRLEQENVQLRKQIMEQAMIERNPVFIVSASGANLDIDTLSAGQIVEVGARLGHVAKAEKKISPESVPDKPKAVPVKTNKLGRRIKD